MKTLIISVGLVTAGAASGYLIGKGNQSATGASAGNAVFVEEISAEPEEKEQIGREPVQLTEKAAGKNLDEKTQVTYEKEEMVAKGQDAVAIAAADCSYSTIPDSVDTPKYRVELIQEMFELSKSQEQMAEVLAATSEMMKASLKDSGLSKEKMEQVTNLVEKNLGWEKFAPVMEKIYAKTYSAQELSDLNQFYATTAGQALVEKTPKLAIETQAAMMEIVGAMQGEIGAIVSGEKPASQPAH